MKLRRALELSAYPILLTVLTGIAAVAVRSLGTRTVHPATPEPTVALPAHRVPTPVLVMFRVVVRERKDRNQVIQLYLTPQKGTDSKEFLAFEYTAPASGSTSATVADR